MRSHSVQEIVANENVEIRVDTRITTTTTVRADRPDILVYHKNRHELSLIEIGIIDQDMLIAVETEKKQNAQEHARKHLIRSAPWIRRGRISGDQHSRAEREAIAARMPEYNSSPESIVNKEG
ncbi:unnamed protein product [Thelazia callipaeda]|uniref:DUF2382 domain-containing protein n=1 Tax=Thelazia callipaeda TaxID=103827 RepID=A0A0N5CLD8_THECL|nr:unnamed protein product [Thelazia callipaeda]